MSDDPEVADDAELRRLLDDERHADAVAARRREQSLRNVSAESGTLVGVLVDLAERRAAVSLITAAGRSIRGAITSLGADVVVTEGPAGETVLLALDAVSVIRTEPGTVRTAGDRQIRSDATLADLLVELAPDRPQVVIHAGGAAVAGELRAAGLDVATVVQSDRSVAYVAVRSITEVAVP